jgi:diacylglycerol kinase (ATP)
MVVELAGRFGIRIIRVQLTCNPADAFLRGALSMRLVNMVEKKDTLIRHIMNAFVYTFAGLKAVWKNELAFRTEAVVILILLPAGIWLGRSAVEWALLIASCLLILITELLNSALEAVVDRIGPQRHELSKRAKDMGSAAAFISMITAAVVWGMIAFGRFFG